MKKFVDPYRPTGRFFYLLLSLLLAAAVTRVHAQNPPATTLVQDKIFDAGGQPASGTLILSWTQFTTADGRAIAAGTRTVNIGSDGVVSVALVPNAGSDPASYYKVTIKLQNGQTDEEVWTVPATSPAAISVTDAVANREIINPDQFRDGLSKIIDGTVACLNASSWAKK